MDGVNDVWIGDAGVEGIIGVRVHELNDVSLER